MAPTLDKSPTIGRRLWLTAAAAAAALSICLSGSPGRAEPVYLPGSQVGIELLPGLTRDPAAPRFRDERQDATLVVMELPGPAYEEVSRGLFTAESEPNVTVIKREAFAFSSGMGFLAEIRLKPKDATAWRHKWLLLARAVEGEPTALVTFDIPDSASNAFPDQQVRAMFASLRFRPPPIEEQLGLLPVVLTNRAGFRVVRVHPLLGILLTDGPQDQGARQPTVLVSFGPQAPSNPNDRMTIAQELLRGFGIPELRITSAETIRLKNQPVYEVRAEARDPTGVELAVIQWMRFSETSFLRIVATAPKDDWEAAFPRFRAIRDGIEPR